MNEQVLVWGGCTNVRDLDDLRTCDGKWTRWGTVILEGFGFAEVHLETVILHGDDSEVEAFLPQLDPDRLLSLVKVGLLSEQELSRMRFSREAFLVAERPTIATLLLMACGKKPYR